MKRLFPKAVLLAGALAVSAGALAIAAPPAAPDARATQARDDSDGPRHHRHDPAKRAAHLRAVLQLTPQQEPALQTFLASAGPGDRRDRGERRGRDAARLTTPERLDRKATRLAERQEAFARRAAATKAFYAQLTAPQKTAFDALSPGRGDRHGRGGRGHSFGPRGDRAG